MQNGEVSVNQMIYILILTNLLRVRRIVANLGVEFRIFSNNLVLKNVKFESENNVKIFILVAFL